jgi:alpha-N-arabinofuranosidase
MIHARNPILSGFYPDPSICRVGEDYYLVNSSFAYFPGVPIWHSKNLADWNQIGNILDRNSQLPLNQSKQSGGIFAPTIRYNNGVYYMITTNVSAGGNFIVTSNKPEGPWSEPHFLGGEAQGIDPSLFFDEDGKGYYVGTRPNPEGVRYNGDWEIWVQEIDLDNFKLIGESYSIWKGALKDVIWPEGPHIYKKDDFYYVMIAEGGTGPNHAVTVARSKDIYGPYENNPNNPILTHRHLGKEYPIIYVGHGDLVDDTKGNWYMVLLASRRCEGYVGLGRETFLAKVVWEDGWPIVNPGVGKLEELVELPFEEEERELLRNKNVQSIKNWKEDRYDVVTLRNHEEKFYHVNEGKVRLNYLPTTLKELKCPAYLGFRQLSYHYQAILEMEFEQLNTYEEAGLSILQSNEYHMLFVVKNKGNSSAQELVLQVIKCTNSKEQILVEKHLDVMESCPNNLKIKVKGHGQRADFILLDKEYEIPILLNVDIHEMSTEVAGGFVGNTIGVYASSNGEVSNNYMDILEFYVEYH